MLIGFVSTNSFSQDDSIQDVKKYYLIVKNDGGEYYGYILKDDGRELLLQTENIGNIYINKSDVKLIKVIEKSEAKPTLITPEYSDLRQQGPFTTRYYFTTNALPIKKKENYAMIHLYGPEVHFAVTDNLSIGVMASWIASPIAVALKYSFNNSNPDSDVHFALGSIVSSGGYLAPQIFGGLHFATITKGNRSSNMSFSLGFSHINQGPVLYSARYNKYSYQHSDPNGKYYVEPGYANDFNSGYIYPSQDYNLSLVVGVSGIKPVGKKTSFIFDSMVLLNGVKKEVYSDVTRTFSRTLWDEPGVPKETITRVIGGDVELVSSGLRPTILLMPGMRFNREYGNSFQVVLSGIIYDRGNGNYRGFPVPMVSWLKAF